MASIRRNRPTASVAQAEAGQDDYRIMTADKVRRHWIESQGEGSGLDADLLDGNEGAFYRDAANLNAGYIDPARIQSSSINAGHLGEGSSIRDWVGDRIADMATDDPGCYAYLFVLDAITSNKSRGDTLSGSNLTWSNASGGMYFSGQPNGVWMCLGYVIAQDGSAPVEERTTLFRRVS